MGTDPGGRGGKALAETVSTLYQLGQTDYYLEPIVVTDRKGQPLGRIQDGDSVIFCCRRGEREIQLTEAFTDPAFDHFPRLDFKDLTFVILTLYHEKFQHLPIAYPPSTVSETLGELVSQAGLSQLRVAESEKFAHITSFLNGGKAHSFQGEVDVCVPSPKGIPFDQVPGLSLPEVCQEVMQGLEGHYDFIAVNFANGDVIGHTENCPAKLECAGIIDRYVGQVIDAAWENDYLVMVTADHGNLEVMKHPDGSPHVSHTTNPVPFILIDPRQPDPAGSLRDGRLADVGPTILSALGVDRAPAMDGSALVEINIWDSPRRVLLIILDGWGIGQDDETNPIFLSETPIFDGLLASYPHSRLQASGEAVGLKAGKAGNSEAGHMNIGAGRVVLQDDVRLDLALQDGSFYTNPVFLKVIEGVKEKGTQLHLIALLSEKSSHGSIDYPLALLKLAKEQGLEEVWVHVIFDGRSTEPGSAPGLLGKFENQIEQIGLGQIVSGVGRGLALDRDGNYQKIQKAYDALVFGRGRNSFLA
jgi:2,3-bisphosphoglycerate-independent phosphoglycerate mutase